MLAEISDEAFTLLAKFTEPKVITKPRDAAPSCNIGCGAAGPPQAGAAQESFRVLEEKRVAGYDAAVLDADNAKALGDWLQKHGYAQHAELANWLEPYVKQGWKITAFKIAKEQTKDKVVSSSLIRMTFQTDRPFFPYREPENQRDAKSASASLPRLLRVYVLAPQRMRGVLGSEDDWPGHTVHASDLSGLDIVKLWTQLKMPGQTLDASSWLTELENRSSPRPGTNELCFAPDQR